MRVISGSARGRKLIEPKGEAIRPTSDKVKEAIFTIIQFDIEGRRVLDLFAGTGQLGIEALSRGAASVVFVDEKPDAAKIIRDNLRVCKFSDQAVVYTTDAMRYLEYDEKFDIIFVDAPYDTQLASKALSKITVFDKLNINGIIIVEAKTGTELPEINLPYELIKEYKYGGVTLFKLSRRE
ncbi:MAG: 16S rRNA (guanine(966)-N(2))-methyltransferase RsmD [Oscillospiraceae bacterium]|nr:16S rRNA (guanine(966)-N(2))-methyltransferase RsmD [Oscillospiraceae bacterium]